MHRWVTGFSNILLIFCLFCSNITEAAVFQHEGRGYRFSYDDARYVLISPALLTTDLVLRRKTAESGFYPNLVMVSQAVDAGFNFKQEVATTRARCQELLSGAQMLRNEPITFKGHEAVLMEFTYVRDAYRLALRMIMMKTPQLFLSISITSPVESQAQNFADFMAVLNSLELPG